MRATSDPAVGPSAAGRRARPASQGAGGACIVGRLLVAAAVALAGGCTSPPTGKGPAMTPEQQVEATERAFAATMARRDLPGFASFVDDEAVFFSGPMPLRGRDAVVAWWARYFGGAAAPFSWEPDQVVVLASGALAHSSGPVRAPDGKPFARFDSIWRRQADGAWKIVFDKGSPLPPRAEPR
jgi:ketosteroid isomerase-like protein